MKQVISKIRRSFIIFLIAGMVLTCWGCGVDKEQKQRNPVSDLQGQQEELMENQEEQAEYKEGSAKQADEINLENLDQETEVYHAVYDETGILWSEELELLSSEILPNLTEKYGIDMRVDVLTDLGEFKDLEEAAEHIYREYDYGSVYGKNGVTLTLLVHKDENGVALDAWYPYAAGESWELTTHGTWNICRESDTWLTSEAWEGDCENDAKMLAGAVNDMAVGLENFVLAGGVGSTIWNPFTGTLYQQSATAEFAEEDTYWVAYEWYSEDGQGAEGSLALSTENWWLVSGETEGWEWEAMPGQMESLVFREAWTAESATLVVDSEQRNYYGDLEESFCGKEITILEEPLYEGCENDAWSVRIGPVSPKDEKGCPTETEYYVTLLDQNTLLMQRYYALDGYPAVSYQKFYRILPQVSRWEIEAWELEGSYWECAWYRDADGVESSMSPGMKDFYLYLDMEQVCYLGQLLEGSEYYTDTQGVWLFGNGGVLQLCGDGYESPEGYCPEFWYAGAVFGNVFETEDEFWESYEMYLYYNGGVICLTRAQGVG